MTTRPPPSLDKDLESRLPTLADLVRKAGAAILEFYNKKHVEVSYKTAADPVTEADKTANVLLVNGLRKAFPGDGIVAEETKDQSDGARFSRCWYVDPLDGTKEFLKRNGEFSVMVGLAIDGAAQLGVVYQPVKDKLYTGIVGEGAFVEQAGRRQALQVSSESDTKALRLVVSRSHRSTMTDALVQALGVTKETQSGSVGLKVGLIAEQAADLYVHLSDKSCAWDACAPEAILRAAGGCFCALDGAPFRYDGQDMQNRRGILACNKAAFAAVLPAVRAVAERGGLLAPV